MQRNAAAPPPAAKRNKAAAGKGELLWTAADPPIVRAMVLGAGRLAVAGPVDLGKKDPNVLAFTNPAEALAGFEGQRGVYLRILRAADGREISECRLPAMPVFDGLSAANGRLYVAMRDGQVMCLAPPP
jgi:hypothetical protein